MALAAGTRLGAYEVTGTLGAGGMGEVYRATDTNLKRDVAIKILPSTLADDADRLARFQREAEVLASLNHPNIAQIHGLERSEGTTALVMELVEGPTLADRIADGPIPPDEALHIAMQIADALEAAHDLQIVHRDLKPANIKLRPDGAVKVLDFGVAKALDPQRGVSGGPQTPSLTTPAMTQAGMLLGTAAYMSPEQARGKAVDERADIWAFGCVLYEMLTGQLAFGGEDVGVTLARVIANDTDLKSLPAAISPAVKRTIELCLQKDPRKRIADIRDVKISLAGAFAVADAAGSAPARWRTRAAVGIASVVAISSFAAATWLANKPVMHLPETHVEIGTPVTTTPGDFAISPDGRRLVYTATLDGRTSLQVRSLDGGSAMALDGTQDAILPFWSPDSRSVAFFKDGSLKVADVGSGAIRDLAGAAGGRGGSWSVLGDVLFAPTGVGGLMRISAKGGEATIVTRIRASERQSFPFFLPNGRDFLFFVTGLGNSAVYAARLGGGPPKHVVDADGPAVYAAGDLIFIRQGRLFAQPFDLDSLATTGDPVSVERSAGSSEGNVVGVSASPAGAVVYRIEPTGASRRLAWFDRAGAEILNVTGLDTNSFALDSDGQRLALARSVGGNADIWTVDLRRGAMSRFTTDPEIDAHPLFSSDGQRLIYQRFFPERSEGDIYWRPVAGGPEEVLIADGRGKIPTDVSQDGSWLLFKAAESARESTGVSWDLWAMPLGGDRQPIPVAVTPFNEADGQFSPNGTWVLFQSDESGQYEVYLKPFGRAGARVQVSVGGGAQPRWRADGREIFYVALDSKLMSVPVEPNKDPAALPTLGRPEPLFTTNMGPVVVPVARQRYLPAPDGQRFLMSVIATRTASPLQLILNFDPAARRE